MPLADLLAGMRAHGVAALSAYPDEHRFLLNGITFGEVLEAMIDRRIPLFLRGGGGTGWARTTDLLREFPRLIVIAADFGVWGQDRFIRPLMERFEGFHIETSTLELDGGIPSLVARYGPGRILFGSGFHRRPMGGASLLLRNVDIAPDAKQLIAHGNLERLLEQSKP
jgi:predicted TIM-barrel fold metal-dependent hydrolase